MEDKIGSLEPGKFATTLEQGNRILAEMDEGLRLGGLGIGSTLGYMRAGVSSREVFELQKLAGLYGCYINMHFRLTPGDAVAHCF